MMKTQHRINALIATYIGIISTASATVGFTALGYLPGDSASSAKDVSADGSVVVGYSTDGVLKAFRWTESGGMVYIGDLPGGATYSTANGISADGGTIVGGSKSYGGQQAFRWSQVGGMVGLGDLSGGNFYGIAKRASSDGSVIIGYSSSSNGYEAFRWTQSGGMIGLGDLVGGSFYSIANDVSGDGAIVVGHGSTVSGVEAFMWTQAEGMVGLGDLPSGVTNSRAYGISGDGTIIVGFGVTTNGTEASRWTQAGGWVGLGDLLGGGSYSIAYDVSEDGSVIVGTGSSTNGVEVFVWDVANGMRSLKTILEDGGLDMSGWTLETVVAVSDDGTTIVGRGNNPSDNEQDYVAVIPKPSPPPPPGEIGITGNSGSLVDGGNESFGNQAEGIGKVQTFTISNEATGDPTSLSNFSISKSGTDASAFSVGPISVVSLSNGQPTTFRVTFTPSSAAAHSAAIHISSNDEDENPFDINLSGVGLANSDSEPGSDAWETSNGFSPWVSDFYTLDSDGDGIPDIWEMYWGWPRYPSFPSPQGFAASMSSVEVEDQNGFMNVYTSSNGTLKVQYRRSTTQTALIANPIWTSNLTSNDWKYSGESDLGMVISVSEIVVSNGVGYEIVESSAEVAGGDADALFFSLELTPNE